MRRYELLLMTLDALELGKYTGGLDASWCSDTICWLWQFRKISKEEKDALCDRVINLLI